MENAQEILVIFLSTALLIFLLLGITLLVICVKIANHIKHLSEKAESIVDKADDVADFFKNAATPMTIARAISGVVDMFGGRKKKGRR